MYHHHQLKAINSLSLQIFDLKCKLKKPTHFHNPTHWCKYCSFFSKIFFSYRKVNFIIIKFFGNFFVGFFIPSGCSFEGWICLTWHHKKRFWSFFFFWCWLVLFLNFLIQWVSSCNNFLITVDKLNVNVLRLDWFNNPAKS